MAKRGGEPVRTFTVGFDFEHDELAQAAFTAKELGCRHTEIESRAEDVALLPEIVWHLDEPVGDAIVVPMYQLAREAKKQVSVILAGEGAYETLGGYLFHKALLYGDRLAHAVPEALRRGHAARASRNARLRDQSRLQLSGGARRAGQTARGGSSIARRRPSATLSPPYLAFDERARGSSPNFPERLAAGPPPSRKFCATVVRRSVPESRSTCTGALAPTTSS
jgi:hypothetical protein